MILVSQSYVDKVISSFTHLQDIKKIFSAVCLYAFKSRTGLNFIIHFWVLMLISPQIEKMQCQKVLKKFSYIICNSKFCKAEEKNKKLE